MKSHAVWPASGPTARQLKELFAQIESGRMTRRRMTRILRDGNASLVLGEVEEILGPKKFFGPKQWKDRIGETLTKRQVAQFARFQELPDILEDRCFFYPDKPVKDTHFGYVSLETIGGKALDLVELHRRFSGPEHPKIWTDWQDTHDFAKGACVLTLHLALIGAVPGSTSKPYAKRLELLPPGYKPPKAVDRVLFEMLYHKLNGVYPDQEIWVAVDDMDNGGLRVNVRCHPTGGVGVSNFGGYVGPDVGLAAEREFSLILNS